jgi:hypothetical protein
MHAMETSATKIAEALVNEHRNGIKFRCFAARCGIADASQAYGVQREYVRLQMAERGVGPV